MNGAAGTVGRLRGCPCGCLDGDCVSDRPAPTVAAQRSHCCLQLSLTQLEVARRNGWNCARGCVAVRLGLVGVP